MRYYSTLTYSDEGSASSYLSAMAKINSTLYSAHYNGAFFQECASRTRDSAVIVGFNDAYDKLDGLLAPTSIEGCTHTPYSIYSILTNYVSTT